MLFNSFLIITAFVCSLSNAGRVYVKIGSPEFKKPLLALYGRCVREEGPCQQMQEVMDVFSSDMVLSNTFIMLPKETMPEDGQKDNLAAWKVSGAEYLVSLSFDKRSVLLKLIQLSSGEEIISESVRFLDSDVDTAHEVSDLVYRKLTGEPSIFKTKIAMSCSTDGDKYKNLFVMDYDGRRLTQLTNYQSLCVSPAWSPDGKLIAYTRYVRKYRRDRGNIVNQELQLINARSRRETRLSDAIGQNSGAAWSPDGKNIVFTMSREQSPNIYIMNVDDKKPRLLIKTAGMDVEPSYSPDGRFIVFSSSKTGNPELYKFDVSSGEHVRLTYSRYYNSSPSWSPMGDMIAFAGLDNPFGERAYFDIFLVSPTGAKLERLTIDSRNNEDPSWAPNGRHLVFSSTRNRGSDIYMINGDGTGERRLTKGIKCYSPDWSK